MTNSPTPAGWYRDAQGAIRWWDGNQWTEHTQEDRSDAVATSSSTSITSSAIRNVLKQEEPAADADTMWSAIGKPLTGIGGGRYRLTEEYLFFEKGTLSTKAQQILTHEIYDVDASQTMTQKARGVGTIVLFTVRTGSGARERVEIADIENFRDGVAVLNRVSHEARARLRTQMQTQHINYSGVPTMGERPADAPPTPAPSVDLNAELSKLVAYREQGILSDEEFAAAKRKLLGL